MYGMFLNTGRWPVRSLKGLLAGWLIAEVLAFCLAVKLLGVGGTMLLGLVTTLLGMAMLRRLGLDAARRLRRAMVSGTSNDDFVDGTLTAVGAVLLIVPGFVSDAAGLALASPSVRQAVAARIVDQEVRPAAQRGRSANADVIDLSPDDWRIVDKAERV